MKFCHSCGKEIVDEALFCTNCGASQQPNQQNANTYEQPEIIEPYDAQKDADDNKIISILAYLSILFLVPLLAAPNSKFARFHANQGLVLFLAELIGSVLCAIPFIGWLAGGVISVITVVLSVLGIIAAAKGEMKELPIIGKYQIIK